MRKYLLWAIVFAGLLALTAPVTLPVPGSPVPVSLNNLFVLLAGLLLGSRWGAVSVLLYLLLGICGLPVFSDGGHGWAHLSGPTGGYLLGYVMGAFTTGYIAERGRSTWVRDLLAATAGAALFFIFGLPWLQQVADLTWSRTLAVGLTPFLVGAVVKIVVAVLLARAIRPLVFQKSPHPKIV